jgi:predicted HNH restriction endonuclease
MDVKKAIFMLYGLNNSNLPIKSPHKTLAEQKPNNAYGVPINDQETKMFMKLFNLTEDDWFQESIGGRIVNDILTKKIDTETMLSINDTQSYIAEEKNFSDAMSEKTSNGFEKKHPEGAEKKYIQTIKERSPKLREDAIKKYGTICMVCEFNFDTTYGNDIADNYIEVHHKKLLSETIGEVETDLNDVIVVCSNCHRIIHRKKGNPLDWLILNDIVNRRKKESK